MSVSADFNCAICLDTATEPVVTRCGHLFCWGCLDRWIESPAGGPACPTCKGRVDPTIPGDIIPLYGKGRLAPDPADPRPLPATVPSATKDAAGQSSEGTGAAATTTSAASANNGARDTSYHFSYVHRPPGAGTESSGSSGGAAPRGAPHPRPTAARAPTPPRAAHHNRGGAGGGGVFVNGAGANLPLSLGGSFVFLGGSPQLTVLFLVMWAAYNFVPWREWKESLQRRVRSAQQHGLPAFFRSDGARPPQPQPQTQAQAQPAATAPAEQAPELLPQGALRSIFFCVFAFVVLANLLIAL